MTDASAKAPRARRRRASTPPASAWVPVLKRAYAVAQTLTALPVPQDWQPWSALCRIAEAPVRSELRRLGVVQTRLPAGKPLEWRVTP